MMKRWQTKSYLLIKICLIPCLWDIAYVQAPQNVYIRYVQLFYIIIKYVKEIL